MDRLEHTVRCKYCGKESKPFAAVPSSTFDAVYCSDCLTNGKTCIVDGEYERSAVDELSSYAAARAEAKTKSDYHHGFMIRTSDPNKPFFRAVLFQHS